MTENVNNVEDLIKFSKEAKRLKRPKFDPLQKVDESEVIENKLIDGVRVPYVTGYNVDYKCKERGCGVTVFVPVDVYNKKKEK